MSDAEDIAVQGTLRMLICGLTLIVISLLIRWGYDNHLEQERYRHGYIQKVVPFHGSTTVWAKEGPEDAKGVK